jgi:hypothetical protein
VEANSAPVSVCQAVANMEHRVQLRRIQDILYGTAGMVEFDIDAALMNCREDPENPARNDLHIHQINDQNLTLVAADQFEQPILHLWSVAWIGQVASIESDDAQSAMLVGVEARGSVKVESAHSRPSKVRG